MHGVATSANRGFTRDGIAVMPDVNKESELSGSDMARWTGLTAANKRQMMTTKPYPEIDVTQEMRQVAFDNWETTDDHGMVIYGIAKDQNGKEYFMVKNFGVNQANTMVSGMLPKHSLLTRL